MSNYKYRATIWKFGHDVYGNAIAHYELRENGKVVARSGKRREQTGYETHHAGGPISHLWEMTGKVYETASASGSRSNDRIEVALRPKRKRA